jgi:hypothetical protein
LYDQEVTVHERADHWDTAGARRRDDNRRCLPQTRDQHAPAPQHRAVRLGNWKQPGIGEDLSKPFEVFGEVTARMHLQRLANLLIDGNAGH